MIGFDLRTASAVAFLSVAILFTNWNLTPTASVRNGGQPKTLPVADTVYFGGDILTMRGSKPEYVERLAIRNGTILYAGSASGVTEYKGPGTRTVNLNGKTLLPGFIDAHGHIVDYASRWSSPDLSPPPVSDVREIDTLVARMKIYIAKTPPPPGKIVFATGYDDSLLKEKRHPTRADLDRISATVPIMVVHASGHLVVVNSAALKLAKISRGTPNPPGGIIQKDPKTGEPNGIFEEQAATVFMAYVPYPTLNEQMAILDRVQAWYASKGITTAQDGISSAPSIQLLTAYRKRKHSRIDIVSYPQWSIFNDVLSGKRTLNVDNYTPGYMESNEGRATKSSAHVPVPAVIDNGSREKVGVYINGVKFGGIKITGDGSPQGKTAYLTKPYFHPPHGQPSTYRAYPTLPQGELDAWFDTAYKNNIQVLMHCNGDAAADMMIAAVSAAVKKYGRKDLRPVMIHAQFVRRDQMEQMKRLHIIPSFFTAHTFFWGDWHINETMGRTRAFGMSPMHTANALGMRFTNHTDSPVVPPDILMLIGTAVNRTSRSGVVVGPKERVSPYVALQAVTSHAAYQYFEDKTKGTLEPGKRADLVILNRNPLKVSPAAIKNLRVVTTIKDGKTVYDESNGPVPGPGER